MWRTLVGPSSSGGSDAFGGPFDELASDRQARQRPDRRLLKLHSFDAPEGQRQIARGFNLGKKGQSSRQSPGGQRR